ncbi:MAG: FAD-dependent oxidoreductase [Armatimonadetes bacterium]|nr:FAD-dependent oxidoreductase [Armatimonadota bacterium]
MDYITDNADVLIIGGGTAGHIAAIQAAKLGARTAIIEAGPQLGGTMTTGGVSFPGLFHAWGRQVIAGIGWELVLKAVDLDSGTLPDFSVVPPRHSQHHVRINGPVYAALAEETCLDAGVVLHYYETAIDAEPENPGWRVETAGRGVRRAVTCRQVIDCTGGADIVGMLGFERRRDEVIQPGTLIMVLGGYDPDALDPELIQSRYRAALESGALRRSDFSSPDGQFIHFLKGRGINANHIPDADSSTSVAYTNTNIAGRASMLRLLRFIRSLPGCEDARVIQCQAEVGVRETYRIVGETTITVEDYMSGRTFEDAVCNAFYPIDVHDEHGVTPQPLSPGTVPTVPLRALVPKGSENLLVAGRSVSSDRLANSALRVQATCMAIGQAAGACAALACRAAVTPLQVPHSELVAVLREHGAIVP